MIVGICGRENSGKTTIANFLSETSYEKYITEEVENYVIENLFDFSQDLDPEWKLTKSEAKDVILKLFRKTIDTNFEYPSFCEVVKIKQSGEFMSCSFAETLKLVASAIFEIDYEILLGETHRELRETITTKNYNICGVMTGRKCLEYLGTEVFRKNFDEDIWIKIAKRKFSGKNVIIPDMRFRNEAEAIKNMNGKIILVYRDLKDLEITEIDKNSHPAKWSFLTFCDEFNIIKVENSGTKEDLYKKISALIII